MKLLKVLVLSAAFAAMLSIYASAATFRVDTTTDDASLTACTDAAANDCSLRGAVTAANALAGGDIITLPAGTYTLTLATTDEDANVNGDLDVLANSDITLVGAGARSSIVQAGTIGGANGNGVDRVFDILASGTLAVYNVTVRNGRTAGAGGGIRNGGNLTVDHVTIADNRTTGSSGGGGLEILTATNTFVLSSTISGNSINASSGGGIRTIGTAQVVIANSTISGNTAAQTGGGGIRAQSGAGGLITITDSTITGNTLVANAGGGLSNSTVMRVRNTIISGNTALTNPDASGAFTSGGTNIVGAQGTSTGWLTTGATADLLNNTSANLGPLQNNGGATDTNAVAAPSSAIDAGQDCVITFACDTFNVTEDISVDQRGYTRIAGGDRQTRSQLGAAVVDIGAFEFGAVPAAGSSFSVAGRLSSGGGFFPNKQIVSLTTTQGTRFAPVSPFGYFRFDNIPAGQTIVLDVASKAFTFTPQVVTVERDITDIILAPPGPA